MRDLKVGAVRNLCCGPPASLGEAEVSEPTRSVRVVLFAPFAVAVLCFFLPFGKLFDTADPDRNVGVSGMTFAIGGNCLDRLETQKQQRILLRTLATSGLALALAALVVSLLQRYCAAGLSGLLSLGCLCALYFVMIQRRATHVPQMPVADAGIGLILALVFLFIGASVAFFLYKPDDEAHIVM